MRFLRLFATIFAEPEVYLAAGRLVPEDVLSKLQQKSGLVERMIDLHNDERSIPVVTPDPDDPYLAKFMLTLYQTIKQSKYTRQDLDFLAKMAATYLNSKSPKDDAPDVEHID